MALEKLLNVPTTAELIGVKPNTLYKWAYLKLIPAQKVGKRLMFSPSALEKWLKKQAR